MPMEWGRIDRSLETYFFVILESGPPFFSIAQRLINDLVWMLEGHFLHLFYTSFLNVFQTNKEAQPPRNAAITIILITLSTLSTGL